MWGFPEVEIEDAVPSDGPAGEDDPTLLPLSAARELARSIGLEPAALEGSDDEVEHRYSHIAARYRPVRAEVAGARPHLQEPWTWLTPSEAEGLPLPKVQRTLLRRMVLEAVDPPSGGLESCASRG
jgi:adenine-specific DNA glycosylase